MTTLVKVKATGKIYELVDKHRDAVWLDTYKDEPEMFKVGDVEPVPSSVELLSKAIDTHVLVRFESLVVADFYTTAPTIRTVCFYGSCLFDKDMGLPLEWASVQIDKYNWTETLVFTVPQPNVITKQALWNATIALEKASLNETSNSPYEERYMAELIELNEALIAMEITPSELYSEYLKERGKS